MKSGPRTKIAERKVSAKSVKNYRAKNEHKPIKVRSSDRYENIQKLCVNLQMSVASSVDECQTHSLSFSGGVYERRKQMCAPVLTLRSSFICLRTSQTVTKAMNHFK